VLWERRRVQTQPPGGRPAPAGGAGPGRCGAGPPGCAAGGRGPAADSPPPPSRHACGGGGGGGCGGGGGGVGERGGSRQVSRAGSRRIVTRPPPGARRGCSHSGRRRGCTWPAHPQPAPWASLRPCRGLRGTWEHRAAARVKGTHACAEQGVDVGRRPDALQTRGSRLPGRAHGGAPAAAVGGGVAAAAAAAALPVLLPRSSAGARGAPRGGVAAAAVGCCSTPAGDSSCRLLLLGPRPAGRSAAARRRRGWGDVRVWAVCAAAPHLTACCGNLKPRAARSRRARAMSCEAGCVRGRATRAGAARGAGRGLWGMAAVRPPRHAPPRPPHLAERVRLLGAAAEGGHAPHQLRRHVGAQQQHRRGGRLRRGAGDGMGSGPGPGGSRSAATLSVPRHKQKPPGRGRQMGSSAAPPPCRPHGPPRTQRTAGRSHCGGRAAPAPPAPRAVPSSSRSAAPQASAAAARLPASRWLRFMGPAMGAGARGGARARRRSGQGGREAAWRGARSLRDARRLPTGIGTAGGGARAAGPRGWRCERATPRAGLGTTGKYQL
jgi:hypothetical protein